ncbi:MAG: DUF2612 domain-containing protein [Rickettsiales bacterium]|jgi:hypothetical protein|nr:DUF2612 domain-containing protein [Rickettsiales bacterium]
MKTPAISFDFDESPVILWQYLKAKNLQKIVSNEKDFYDVNVKGIVEYLRKSLVNIETADANGLNLWGKILSIPRPSYVDSDGIARVFDDNQYKLLLRAKLALNGFIGSVPSLAKIFKLLFPDYYIKIYDNLNMTATISFIDAQIPPEVRVVLNYEDFPPRPSGVKYIIFFVSEFTDIFGFEDMSEISGFDQGTFLS